MTTEADRITQVYAAYITTITAAESRRQTYLSMLLGITAAALALFGSDIEIDPVWIFFPLGAIGWTVFFNISYLKKLATAKFKAVEVMEAKLPVTPFRTEWQAFKDSTWFELPFGLSDMDRMVSLIVALSATIYGLWLAF